MNVASICACLVAFLILSEPFVDGLAMSNNPEQKHLSSGSMGSPSRRHFLQRNVAAVVTAGLLRHPANAYERRDVGDNTRSATTAAFNEQAYITNNRLEASGFKLDTREEEQAKLSRAMASFSYESATPKRKTGYGPSSATTGPSSKSTQR